MSQIIHFFISIHANNKVNSKGDNALNMDANNDKKCVDSQNNDSNMHANANYAFLFPSNNEIKSDSHNTDVISFKPQIMK